MVTMRFTATNSRDAGNQLVTNFAVSYRAEPPIGSSSDIA